MSAATTATQAAELEQTQGALLYRRPLGFGPETPGELLETCRNGFVDGGSGFGRVLEAASLSPGVLVPVCLLLVMTVLLHVFTWRRSDPLLDRISARVRTRLEGKAGAGVVALAGILLHSWPPVILCLFSLWLSVSGDGDGSLWLLWRLSRLYAVLTLIVVTFHELRTRNVLPSSASTH